MIEPSLANKLKEKLAQNDGAELTLITNALIESAKENVTAMKIVVDLIEPDRKQEQERRLTDEELLEMLDRLFERARPRSAPKDSEADTA